MKAPFNPTQEVGSVDPRMPTEPRVSSWDELTCLDEHHGVHVGSDSSGVWALAVSRGMGVRMMYPETTQTYHRKRLDNADRHFRRKAAAVFNDSTSMRLLNLMRSRVLIETEEFDFCRYGRALAKLTAANFCEIGANSVYITEPGQRFVDKING